MTSRVCRRHVAATAEALRQTSERIVVGFEVQARPAEHVDQEARVALDAVFDAELDEVPVRRTDALEDGGEHAVLAVLREHAQLAGRQVASIPVPPAELGDREVSLPACRRVLATPHLERDSTGEAIDEVSERVTHGGVIVTYFGSFVSLQALPL